jgi:short-subunit dehydrogenase
MSNNWDKKTVFLTGASSGIGEALAIALAKKGAIIGLLARREDLLNQIAVKCESVGGKARVDEKGVHSAAESLRNEFGKIDVMIANAGIGNPNHAKNLEASEVKKVTEINFFGAVNAVTAVLPQMIEQNSGQLVAVSSLAGFRGLPRSASYSASKAAMTNFFESLRLDLLNTNVDVTIIQPGFIRTPLTDDRANKMPFLMELDDAIPYFINAIERRKKFSAFPWQLATVVRLARIFPASIYDKIAGRANYREKN